MPDPSRRPGMTQSQGLNSEPRKLLARAASKIRIAVASGLVLIVGAWLTPGATQATLSALQEHAAPLLEEQVFLKEASQTFVGVQDVAAKARAHSLGIPMATPVAPGEPERLFRAGQCNPTSCRVRRIRIQHPCPGAQRGARWSAFGSVVNGSWSHHGG